MLALSNANYDSFVEGDLSAFSKKYVLLPFDPTITDSVNDTSSNHPSATNDKYNDNLVKYYLEYVRNGGNLILLDPEYNYNSFNSSGSPFSKRVSTDFDHFASPVEKKYGNGKIIFAGMAEYYNEISSKIPQRYNNSKNSFLDSMNLSNISGILTPISGAKEDKFNSEGTMYIQDSQSNRAILGNLKASGKTTITSSSVLFPNGEGSNILYAKNIVISNDTREPTGSFSNSSLHRQNDSESIKIEQLELFGEYDAVVEMKGTTILPTTMSIYDYIMMSLNEEFDMSLTFRDGAYADISLLYNGSPKNLRIQNATAHFYGVTADHVGDRFVPLLFKNPEINIIGSSIFREYKEKNVNEIRTNGSLISKFDHSDNYYSDYRNGNRIEFISYLQDSQVNGTSVSAQNSFGIKLPGGLSESWKSEVRWPEAIVSINSIIIATVITIVSILVWPRRKGSKKETKVLIKDPRSDPTKTE